MSKREEPHGPVENWLLATLPRQEYKLVQPHLVLLPLDYQFILFEPGDRIRYVYFPIDAVISLLCLTAEAETCEVGMVGREGMAGLPAFLGTGISAYRVMVQVPGRVLRLQTEVLSRECNRHLTLERLLLRYTNLRLVQITQSAICNQFHTVVEHLCRWLLSTQDRMKSDEIPLTQEFLAQMLGVRRASIGDAASRLQRDGLINYVRGQLTILDRSGLEAAACECYDIVRVEIAQFLGS